jgi:hypothetical protein
VTIATRADELIGDCDLIVTATSAFGQRIVDITKCKPGAVICDVARPPDINPAEAALRPDVLVIESGEVLIPGDIDFGYDIGLPPKTAYACLAETALSRITPWRWTAVSKITPWARNINVERVKEIYQGRQSVEGLRQALDHRRGDRGQHDRAAGAPAHLAAKGKIDRWRTEESDRPRIWRLHLHRDHGGFTEFTERTRSIDL